MPSSLPNLQIWSEFVSFERLLDEDWIARMAEHSATLLVGVTPSELPRLPALLAAARAARKPLGLWPMLEDIEGRWLGPHNVERFQSHLATILDMPELPHSTSEIVFDLEPPVERLRNLSHLRLSSLLTPTSMTLRTRSAQMRALVRAVRSRGIIASAAAIPFVLWERPDEVGIFQRWFATPVDALPFDRIHVMLYTSLLEGYSKGVVSRRDAKRLLFAHARAAQRHYRGRCSVAIGITGPGALLDERPYPSEVELCEDLAIARYAGAHRISVHGLSGIAGNASMFDALRCEAEPFEPSPTLVSSIIEATLVR